MTMPAETLFTITVDSCADLPEEYLRENDIAVAQLTYFADGIEYGTDENPTEPAEVFFEQLRGGRMTKTSQINPDSAYEFLKKHFVNGRPLIHFTLSSGLSGTYNSFCIAADMLKDEVPSAEIYIIDSYGGSLGQGLCADIACDLRKEGKPASEVAEILREKVPKMRYLFTVDDLQHLYRGGRITKMSAVFGGVLGIKPMLHAEDGRLVVSGKIRGRKAALDRLVATMIEQMDRENTEKFAVSHCDSLADAEYVAEQVTAATGITECIFNYISPVLSSHCGPGTVALFFLGK
ncbi:MAG: DegV family protein [Clostridia bacterium]|nr:DegV family protein [Clostridia bacterium]